MAGKENIAPAVGIRVTRALAKRSAPLPAAAATSDDAAPAKRQRVALAELPHLANAGGARALGRQGKKRVVAGKASPAAGVVKPVKEEVALGDADGGDPQLCPPYEKDIYSYLKFLEADPKRQTLPNYIEEVQKDVTANMRGILVDWLVEVAQEYKLVSDTIYLTVSFIDRFLSHNSIARQRLQLLGVSAMLVAAKYEEIDPPDVEDFCYITDNTYRKQEVVEMETTLLKFFNYQIGNPTIKTFLRRFVRSAQEELKQTSNTLEHLTSYLAELCLLDYSCVGFLPSLIAASAVFVATFTIDPHTHPWPKKMQDSTGYSSSDLKRCVAAIHELHLKKRCPNLGAIREKYKHEKFQQVGLLPPQKAIPASYFEEC